VSWNYPGRLETKLLKIGGITMKRKLFNFLMLLAAPALTYLVFIIIQPDNFGSFNSIFILLQQCLLPSVAAFGFYFIITMGLFDFSIGANIVLGGIVGALLSQPLGYFGLFGGGIAVGAIVGLINGIVYTKLKIPSIIVTVGLMMIYECMGKFVSGGAIISLSNDMRIFGAAPYNIIVSLLAMGLAIFLINYSKIGIYIRAIGNNETIARNMGIKVSKYKVVGFMICGLFAGITAILTISYSSSLAPQLSMSSMDRNFTPMMGCFVGLALKKHINPILAIFIGEFTISLLINGLLTNGVDSTLQKVVTGLFLLLIVGVTSFRNKDKIVK
jgi:ribose transport system permease protein